MSHEPIPYINLRPQDRTSFHIRPLRAEIPEDPPHRHNFQELLWITDGQGTHSIDNHIFDIQANSLYVIGRGQVHYFQGAEGLSGYLLRFTDDFLFHSTSDESWRHRTILMSHLAVTRELPIEGTAIAEFTKLFEQIAVEYQADESYGKYELLRHLVSILLIRLERARQADMERQETRLHPEGTVFQEFLAILEQYYYENHDVTFYADQLSVSPRQLNNRVKQFLGKTTKRVIEERIILQAKRYLKYTNYSVKEIAYRLGYRDPAYFSKVFKRATNVSPQSFKE